MNRRIQQEIRKLPRLVLTLVALLSIVLSNPLKANSVVESSPDSLPAERSKLLNGEIIVKISDLPDGVTGVKGDIFIAAPPKKVWEVITDYNNHKKFVPNITDSGWITNNADEKVMFEAGTSGMLFFRKSVHITMKVWGEEFKNLFFQQIAGDFKTYKGEWTLIDYPAGQGTFLTFRAEVKPGFFAPPFAVRNVQRRDCPQVLAAMKKQAELPVSAEPLKKG
ncbi:MAG: SRPBCC family protein [Chlorobiaceae bacterium]